MAGIPFAVAVTLYDTDGTTALNNIKVTLRNERTNETINQNTNSSGQCVLDCADLSSGWSNGDTITVYSIYTNYEDYEEYTIVETDGGTTITLTLVAVPASDTLKYFTVQDFFDFFNLESGNDGVPLTNQVVEIGTMVAKDIDETCQSEFSTSTTVTQEYHDVTSVYQADWFLEKTPVLSVTTLQVNTADDGNAESWVTLTEAAYQFELSLDTGRIRLTGTTGDVTTPVYPAAGVKNMRVTYTHGNTSVPRDIKKLAILMTAKDLMAGSVAKALFRGQDSFKTDHYGVYDKQIDTLLARHRKVEMYNT